MAIVDEEDGDEDELNAHSLLRAMVSSSPIRPTIQLLILSSYF